MTAAIAEVPIEQQALSTVERARSISVTTVEFRIQAAEIGRVVAALDKQAEEFFKPMKQKAAAAHKEICDKENCVRKPLEEAKRYLSGQIGSFDQRMEQERLREEDRLREETRLKAIADAKKISDEQAIQDAIELEAAGDIATAEAVLNHPAPIAVHVPPVVLQRQIPKAEGVSSQQLWKFRITDESLIPREYLVVDEKAVGQVVRAMKNKCSIPGIEVYPEGGARFRA